LLADVGAFGFIKPLVDSNKCLQAQSEAHDARLILQPCNKLNHLQLWAPLQDRTNIYRFQNGQSLLCIQVIDFNTQGQFVTQGECKSLYPANIALGDISRVFHFKDL